MDEVYLLYGEKCGAEELLGVYAEEEVADEVGEAFVTEGDFEGYNIEIWDVVDTFF